MSTRLVRITTVPISLKILLAGQLRFMSENGFEVIAVSADGKEVEQVVMQEGIPHIVVPFSRSITPFLDLQCLFALVKVIRKVRPDIVHTHTPKAGLIGMMAAWWCRVPVRLHTVAGLPLMESSGMKRRLLILTEKLTYACATKVYPNSFNLLGYIRENIYRNVNKTKVIANGSSNGIDTRYFECTEEIYQRAASVRKQYAIRDGEKIILTICRISKEKGIEELVEAFSRLKLTFPSWKLMIVGPHDVDAVPLSASVIDRIQTDPSIIMVDFQSDVRPFLASAEIFAFPSYREGFPNVVLQAACMNLPVVASDINGCNEIIVQGVNGLLIPAKDAPALEGSLRRLIDDEPLRACMKAKTREIVRQKYEREVVWKSILEEYNGHLEDVS